MDILIHSFTLSPVSSHRLFSIVPDRSMGARLSTGFGQVDHWSFSLVTQAISVFGHTLWIPCDDSNSLI